MCNSVIVCVGCILPVYMKWDCIHVVALGRALAAAQSTGRKKKIDRKDPEFGSKTGVEEIKAEKKLSQSRKKSVGKCE